MAQYNRRRYRYTPFPKKHINTSLEEEISNFNNFRYKYFWHNWSSNNLSIFHLTQCLFQHYLGKTEPTEYELK